MKKTNGRWLVIMALLLAGSIGEVLGVAPDTNAPCWRDGINATRQVWLFSTALTNSIPTTTKVGQPGTPVANGTMGAGAKGWRSTPCASGLSGCGAIVYAILPLDEDPCDGTWPYLSNLGRLAVDESCNLTETYSDPSAVGTGQGFFDMGTTGSRVTFVIPNGGAPAGTARFFNIQGTHWVDAGIASIPATYVVTNSAGVGGTSVGAAVNTLMEQPLDTSGDLTGGTWRNNKVVRLLNAATTAGNDTVTIRATSAWWIDSAVVETLDRVAVADTLTGMMQDTTTNIPFASLLGNDLGATNIVGVGSPSTGTVTKLGGFLVAFTPASGFSGLATFWYTNRDCGSLTNMAAQVTVMVVPSNTAPYANPASYNRPKNTSLQINIANLLSTKTGDAETGTPGLVGVTSPSTLGYTIFTNGTSIFYTNANNNNVDTFQYIVADAGTPPLRATNTITINPVGTTGTLTVANIGGGQMTISFYGIPGFTYVMQRSPDLSAWTDIQTNVVPANGLIQRTETPPYSPAYYRTRSQ